MWILVVGLVTIPGVELQLSYELHEDCLYATAVFEDETEMFVKRDCVFKEK